MAKNSSEAMAFTLADLLRLEAFELYVRHISLTHQNDLCRLREIREEMHLAWQQDVGNEIDFDSLTDVIFDSIQFDDNLTAKISEYAWKLELEKKDEETHLSKAMDLQHKYAGEIGELADRLRKFQRYTLSNLSWENRIVDFFSYWRKCYNCDPGYIEETIIEKEEGNEVKVISCIHPYIPGRIPWKILRPQDRQFIEISRIQDTEEPGPSHDEVMTFRIRINTNADIEYIETIVGLIVEQATANEALKHLNSEHRTLKSANRTFSRDRLKAILTREQMRITSVEKFLLGVMCWDEVQSGKKVGEAAGAVVKALSDQAGFDSGKIEKLYFEVNNKIKFQEP